jgi:Tfp pilus assembly protein PilO
MSRISSSVILLAAFCAAFLVGFWTFMLPTLREFGDQQTAVQARERLLSASSDSSQKTVKSDDQQLHDEVVGLLPNGDDHLDLVVQLDALGASLGLPGGSFTVSAPPAGQVGPIDKLPLTFAVNGTQQDINKAVAGLTGLGRYIQIDQIAISQTKSSDSLHADISASAYYLPSAP